MLKSEKKGNVFIWTNKMVISRELWSHILSTLQVMIFGVSDKIDRSVVIKSSSFVMEKGAEGRVARVKVDKWICNWQTFLFVCVIPPRISLYGWYCLYKGQGISPLSSFPLKFPHRLPRDGIFYKVNPMIEHSNLICNSKCSIVDDQTQVYSEIAAHLRYYVHIEYRMLRMFT